MAFKHITREECNRVGYNTKFIDNKCQITGNTFKGKFSSMDRGKLIINPRYLFGYGRYPYKIFGDFDAIEDNLDRVIMLVGDVGISGIDEIKGKKLPRINLYGIEDGYVKHKIYQPKCKYDCDWVEVPDVLAIGTN